MLNGIDVSHWNDLAGAYKQLGASQTQFIIVKASEGKSYKDPKFNQYISMASSYTDLIGTYHYARPEKNTAIVEAKHYLSIIDKYIGKSIMVLDWEAIALKYNISWALQFLDYVYQQTKIRPLLYCSASYTDQIARIVQNNYGLWVAHYTKNDKPYIGKAAFWAMWQYESPATPTRHANPIVDRDYFNGNAIQFKKYMGESQ